MGWLTILVKYLDAFTEINLAKGAGIQIIDTAQPMAIVNCVTGQKNHFQIVLKLVLI